MTGAAEVTIEEGKPAAAQYTLGTVQRKVNFYMREMAVRALEGDWQFISDKVCDSIQ